MVDTTTGVLFPAHPCRDVLVGLTGVLDVTGGLEGGGGHLMVPKKGHAWGFWDNAGHGGCTNPTSILPPLRLKGLCSKYPTQGTGEHQAWGQPPAAPRNGGHEGRNWVDWDQPPVPRKLSSSNGNLHKE